jgi:putative sigma-54 modulation protein
MIELHIGGNNYELGEKIKEYVNDKIGELEKFLPRHARDGVKGSVTLTHDISGREGNQCICEASIPVRGAVLEAREATLNMYAAVDICAAKLKSQIIKYKTKNSPRQNRAKVFVSKLMRRSAEEV